MNKLKLNHILLALLPLMAFSACTKKLDYKTEFKEQVQDVTVLGTGPNDFYLYTASQGLSSRSDAGIRPYWKGEDKVVKMSFTEKELRVLEVEKDSRFTSNSTNTKPLISIPIEHIDYRCAPDRYGQCTNKEEKNSEIAWSEKGKFKPDFSAMKFSEANMLPAEMEKIFGGNCYTEVGANVLDAKFEANALNIVVEKTFRVNIECVGQITSLGELLSNMTASAVYHYSFTKLSSIASADYKSVNYPLTDENTFGFFNTDQNKLDVDGNATVNSKSSLLNRWNPSRKEVIYFLSDEFNKPENAILKAATLEGFKRINRGLKSAGLNFQLVAKDAEGRAPGDNRNSFIVLVEDPLAASILGYGPTTVNPLTGEIVSGRVVMYSGVMKQYIRWTYEEIRRSLQAQATSTQSAPAAENKMTTPVLNKMLTLNSARPANLVQSNNLFKANSSNSQMPSATQLHHIVKTVNSGRYVDDLSSSPVDALNIMSKYCTYPAELFNFNEAAQIALSSIAKDKLLPWQDLSETEKQKMIDIILPHVWIPTLVHEMGHNLGLRHNFKGSEDKDNFYTTEELAQMNIDQPIPYSSVMDYPYSDLNHLPTLGKYDIAALRFGYKREVESNSGNIIQLDGSLQEYLDQTKKPTSDSESDGTELLKSYGYCTDEHVEVNAGCKRFDEGTTFTEIAMQQINSYLVLQQNRNYRNGRANLSATEDHLYAERVSGTFKNLQLYMKVLARLKNDFGLDYDHPIYSFDLRNAAKEKLTEDVIKNIKFLQDLRQAADISMNFLSNVVLTPDVNCIIGSQPDPGQKGKASAQMQVSNMPLAKIKDGVLSCSDPSVIDKLKQDKQILLGQFGTFLNHVKDKNRHDPYVDQIDIRGTWIDKLLAVKTLFGRHSTPNFKSTDNFLDLPEAQQALPNLLAQFATVLGKTQVEIDTAKGTKVKVPVTVSFGDDMLIQKTMSPQLQKSLHLPERDFYLAEWIYGYTKSALRKTTVLNPIGEALANSLTIDKINSILPIAADKKAINSVEVSGQNFIANKGVNIIGSIAIDNLVLFNAVNNPEVRSDKVQTILTAKMDKKEVKLTGLNASEKIIAAQSLETLTSIVEHKFPSNSYLIRLLNAMAN